MKGLQAEKRASDHAPGRVTINFKAQHPSIVTIRGMVVGDMDRSTV